MLPLVSSFPTEGLTFNIAREACLTARKHLSLTNWALYPTIEKYIPYERVLILIDSINNSLEVLWRRSFEENPACTADQLNVDEK